MKPSIIIVVLCIFLFSCHGPTTVVPPGRQQTSIFFPSGIYSTFEESSYCRTWDTLVVSKDPRQINIYHITRRTEFQRNREDDFFAPERSTNNWIATYDPAKSIMYGLDNGPNLLFMPPANIVCIADHLFSKIE